MKLREKAEMLRTRNIKNRGLMKIKMRFENEEMFS